MSTQSRRAWLVSVLCLAAGCGGHGHGAGPVFLGDFHAVSLEANGLPASTCTSSWGSASSTGFVLSLATTQNTDGSIAGPSSDDVAPSVDSDGSFQLRDLITGDAIVGGCVSVGGNVAAAASIRAGDAPLVVAMTRESSGAGASSLSGTFHSVFFTLDTTGRSSSGTATLDGSGGGTLNSGGVSNVDGSISAIGLAASLAYAVASNGQVNVSASAGLAFEGGMDPAGELVVLGGSSNAGTLPGLFVLVKNASAASAATFAGDYGMVGLVYDSSVPAVHSFGGNLSADGAGNASAQGTVNREGTIGPTLAAAYTYSVAADGTLTVVTPDGTLVGGISPSGDFAVLGGPNTAASDPAIYLLVRR